MFTVASLPAAPLMAVQHSRITGYALLHVVPSVIVQWRVRIVVQSHIHWMCTVSTGRFGNGGCCAIGRFGRVGM